MITFNMKDINDFTKWQYTCGMTQFILVVLKAIDFEIDINIDIDTGFAKLVFNFFSFDRLL